PNTHPEVRSAITDVLNEEINPNAVGNVRASDQPREPIHNRVVVRSEDGRLGVIQIGAQGSAQFNEVTNPRSARGWADVEGINIPAEEFEGIFTTQPEGYQPGTIEDARAQFLKDEKLGRGKVPEKVPEPIAAQSPVFDFMTPELQQQSEQDLARSVDQ